MEPDFLPAQSYLGSCYFLKGMYEEALEMYRKHNNQYAVGNTYAKMGKLDEARKILKNYIERAKQGDYRPSFWIATLYFLLGDNEQGFRWLEKAYEYKDESMVFLKVSRAFDNVRSDPRFKALLKKVGLD